MEVTQQSFVSVTVLGVEQRVMGIYCFDQCPKILTGLSDFNNFNEWDIWINGVFQLGKPIASLESLFLVYVQMANIL